MSTSSPTSQELAEAIQQALDLEINGLERRAHPYRSSFSIEELSVSLSDGTHAELVFKNLGWDCLLVEAREAKPRFLYNPRREIDVYQHVLLEEQIGAPYRGSVVDACNGRYWLFLDRVCGTQLHQFGNLDDWKTTARWLADFHTRPWATRGLPDSLTVHGEQFYRTWLRRAFEFTGSGDEADELRACVMERVSKAYDKLLGTLLSLPRTLIHGEFYSTNILICEAEAGGAPAALPIDWENAGVGPALTDLAALTAGAWSEVDRQTIVEAYHEALPQSRRVSFAQLQRELDYCRLQLAIQWLGWSRTWQPPPEKTHDWLTEAFQLCGRLEL